jgi:hypothetical protein
MKLMQFWTMICVLTALSACDTSTHDAPDQDLKVVIIRHAEKPEKGDNLSCQGQNRALQLAQVLYQQFQRPDYIYVPSLDTDKATSHSRMFQTITPFAVKYNLTINSKYQDDDYAGVAESVLKKRGKVLMVWSHQSIPKLAKALGVKEPARWKDDDFDSIWVLSYRHHTPELTVTQQGLSPAASCAY